MGWVRKRPKGKKLAGYRGPDGVERNKVFDRKIDAQRWLASVEVAKNRGEWLDPSLSRVQVEPWAWKWLDAQTQLKPTTRERYKGLLVRYVLPAWGRVALADVTPADVAAWLSRLSESGLGPASVRYAHRVLSLLLGWAVLDGRLTRNPAEGVPLPRVRSRAKRYLDHDQVERLARECGKHAPLIYVLAYTGLRWGEAVAMRVRDVDLPRRRIYVRQAMAEVRGRVTVGTPKDHEQREVSLPGFLVGILAEHVSGKAADELVFPAGGGAYLRNGNFRHRLFDAAAERAGLAGLTPHGLRHTAASLAVQAGANVRVVQQMLGHSSPSVTLNVYSHLYDDALDTVADRLDTAKIKASADQVRTDSESISPSVDRRGERHAV